MIVWLDDERDPRDFSQREGWAWVKTAEECIDVLTNHAGEVTYLSLDHDLGDSENGDGYIVACWLESRAAAGDIDVVPTEINIHSANPVGRKNIEAALASARRFC